ncbi:NAD(P)-binding protein [Hypoxylon sp. FL1284]|nr:NAD(P)-binding protein [Hypoxylon sp. FL1284]
MSEYLSMPDASYLTTALVALAVSAGLCLVRRVVQTSTPSRHGRIQPRDERVLILGASSGLGQSIAKQYAARGARVCIVARRAERLATLAKECGQRCIWVAADFGSAEDMVRLRERLLGEWDGLDSLHVCAGVSAVQPVMNLAGLSPSAGDDADTAGIQRAVGTVTKAMQGNFYGPLVAAVTFIPMLTRASTSPSILLVSSIAAVIPAPTRAVYAATKASSLLLFQSLAIEHPDIAFTFILPATIQGDFRASAIDADTATREAGPNPEGLKVDYVANRCVDAVDRQVTGNVVIPRFPYTIAHHLYNIWPSFIERRARKKYDFDRRSTP